MPQRSEALYRDRIIGIESIYTVINGKQINIPKKLKDLREKSRNNGYWGFFYVILYDR